MKSRISFFDKTIFKKNLTRFAPAWGLYTIALLMSLVTLISSGSRWFASNICDYVQIISAGTACYALLCTQLLFGDLYNSRMCNALHALPLRRETWFMTNVASGFAFHLIPTITFGLLAWFVSISNAHPAWEVAPMWLLGVNLQFICFFGIAVFSAFCVGSRFAQAVVYGILNFASLIAGWLVDTIFLPMYYGVQINMEPFFLFAPIGQMVQKPFCVYNRSYSDVNDQWLPGTLELGENFGYYFIVAAVGAALLMAALNLYRRRKLECAGDFLAFQGLEPVFQVVYTVIVGAVFHFISDEIFGLSEYVFLFVGLAVGWFTGKMLLERTPQVFRRKNILHCGALMAVCSLVLIAAALDPFGIETWVPETEKVESVTIADGHYSYHQGVMTLDDPADIQKIIDIHEEALHAYKNRISQEAAEQIPYDHTSGRMDYAMAFTITYQMKNGRTVNRYYNIWMGDETGEYLRLLFSTPEAVFGCEDVEAFLKDSYSLLLRDTWKGEETLIFQQADTEGLLRAILADCEAGVMAQNGNFHNAGTSLYWIDVAEGLDITVFDNCENTIRWLRDYGLDVDGLIQRKNEFN